MFYVTKQKCSIMPPFFFISASLLRNFLLTAKPFGVEQFKSQVKDEMLLLINSFIFYIKNLYVVLEEYLALEGTVWL